MKIFAAVGTQKFPFNRLIDALDNVARGRGFDVFVQYGSSRAPAVCQGAAFLGGEEYRAMLGQADVAVVHGGVGTVRAALMLGTRVVAVPRIAAEGEHVDNHQKEIVAAFADGGYIIPCYDLTKLGDAIDEALRCDFARFDPAPCTIEEELSELVAKWGFSQFLDNVGRHGV